MSFYLGCYLILADSLEPKTDHGPWALPDEPAQHMSDTSNVEELFLDVTDMQVLPTQIQFGADTWVSDEGFDSDDTFTEFYVKDESFYIRSFSPVNRFSEFYVVSEAFYLRSFSPVNFWTASFYPSGSFYLQNFSPTDYWAEFYVKDESFYLRSFSATGSLWTEFYVPVCG